DRISGRRHFRSSSGTGQRSQGAEELLPLLTCIRKKAHTVATACVNTWLGSPTRSGCPSGNCARESIKRSLRFRRCLEKPHVPRPMAGYARPSPRRYENSARHLTARFGFSRTPRLYPLIEITIQFLLRGSSPSPFWKKGEGPGRGMFSCLVIA